MAILNLTPDSFSDGGHYNDPSTALTRIEYLIDQGADIIDIGAESTRPNAKPISQAEEERRLLPILKAYKKHFDVPLSIDTTKSAIAELALSYGASIINDTSAFRFDPAMPSVIAKHNATAVLMHSIKTPETMQDNPSYTDIIRDVSLSLSESIAIAKAAGITEIILDPGIGFGKTVTHNLQLLNHLDRLKALGYPILVGVSRKSMIGHITGESSTTRLEGTIAANIAAYFKGAQIFRVHDVGAVKKAMQVIQAIETAEPLL